MLLAITPKVTLSEPSHFLEEQISMFLISIRKTKPFDASLNLSQSILLFKPRFSHALWKGFSLDLYSIPDFLIVYFSIFNVTTYFTFPLP